MNERLNNNWYSKKISFYWLIIIVLAITLPYNYFINHFHAPIVHNEDLPEDCTLPYSFMHQQSDKLVHQILFANIAAEDERLMPLKEKINNYINSKKGLELRSAAVYFKALNEAGGWFVINPDEKYNPASMVKIAFAIAMLKEAEDNPAILDNKIYYANHSQAFHDQALLDHQLPPGKSYSIKELLRYTLAYSDNDAAYKIVDNFKKATLNKLMEDLQLPPVDFNKEYYLTVEQMSRFFRILFNASYISNDMSEYALSLLTQSDFDKGIVKKLDKNILVARKFGERGLNDDKELHEFAIIYLKDQPYLLGIMTRGSDYNQLENILSDISQIAYEDMQKPL